MQRSVAIAACGGVVAICAAIATDAVGRDDPAETPEVFNDSHVHLTNYIQEGTDVHDMIRVMGERVHRATLFGIPLQQSWSYRVDPNDAPVYYLDTDTPLYYYSFTDAQIATAYLSLSKKERARFDPMITGFNPADMYAADHVRRVLHTFPNVFVGIGEFSLHKEFVTSKIAGEPPSLDDPALDRLLTLAEEVGLVVLVHCDVDTPFPKPNTQPAYLGPLSNVFKRHPKTTIIWAHIGLGRVVRPVKDQAALVAAMLEDPSYDHVVFDLSWSETAKYIVATPATLQVVADLITKHPDRFLFGTDEVAPRNQNDYLRVFAMYRPLWNLLPKAVLGQVLRGNYERVFDNARRRVRAWEAVHAHSAATPVGTNRP